MTRLPDFLVLGAQKAGSTWFTKNLRAHPDIFMPLKEVRFFTREFDRGANWYAPHFEAAEQNQRIGEGTPGYLFSPSAPSRIQSTLGPDVQLIASLRNPIDRAYSSFWNLVGGGVLKSDAEFLDHFALDTNQLRTRGLYDLQLSKYLAEFSSRNLFIVIFEHDLGPSAPATLSGAFEFLDVDPSFLPASAQDRSNVGRSPRTGGAAFARVGIRIAQQSDRFPAPLSKLLRSTYTSIFGRLPVKRPFEPLSERDRLRCYDFFRADIERLESTIDRDLSVWRP